MSLRCHRSAVLAAGCWRRSLVSSRTAISQFDRALGMDALRIAALVHCCIHR